MVIRIIELSYFTILLVCYLQLLCLVVCYLSVTLLDNDSHIYEGVLDNAKRDGQ